MAITDWPLAERPREKMLAKGAASLSDAELLAIFLRTGVRGKSAVDLARELISRCGSLSALCAEPLREAHALPGFGAAKQVQLHAAMELARRALREKIASGDVLSSPQAVREFLRLRLQPLPHEVFVALFLDLCAAIKNVELAGQARAAEHCPASSLHINFVKAVAANR